MSTDKPKELKFHPQSVGKTHVALRATTKDAVEQKIQSEWKQGGHDIAKSLRDLEMIPTEDQRPERELPKPEADKGKAEEQSGMDICCQEELRQHLDAVQTSQDGMNQACSLTLSTCCSKLMQGRLEALPEFKQTTRNDPAELLKAIKNCMVESVRAQCPLISMAESLIRLANIKMCDQESPLECVQRLKEHRDAMVGHLGKDSLDHHTTPAPACKGGTLSAAAKKKLKEGAWDQWMACLMMKGSDCPRHGSLLRLSMPGVVTIGLPTLPFCWPSVASVSPVPQS